MKKSFALVNRTPGKSCHRTCSTMDMKVPFYHDVFTLDESEIVRECVNLDKKHCIFFVESNFDYGLVEKLS